LVTGAQGTRAPIYLERDLAEALQEHEAFVERAGLPWQAITTGLASPERRQEVQARLGETPRSPTFWGAFYRGLAAPGGPGGRRLLGKALSSASDKPAKLLILYHRLREQGCDTLADSALSLLHKRLLTGGAQATPLVAQQLMHEAIESEAAGNTPRALMLWQWAERFDPASIWPRLRQARYGPQLPIKTLGTTLLSSTDTRLGDWQTQLAGLHFLLTWVLRAMQVLVIGVFVAMALKYFARAIHPYVELFPQSVPMPIRALLVASMIGALFAFGALPFLWVLAFIIWPHMLQRERFVMGVCLVGIALSPLGARLETGVRMARSPHNSPYIYSKSLYEGHYPDLHSQIVQHTQQSPSDPLARLAYALSALKADSLSVALAQIREAEKLEASDPVALNLAGVVNYSLGRGDAAREKFETCARLHPHYAPAYFNQGKSLLDALESLQGAELIGQAGKLGGRRVEKFITTNDTYFGGAWPELRQLLIGDYTPKHFWGSVFWNYTGTWDDTTKLWGNSFLGLSPMVSLLIFTALLGILLVRENTASTRRASRVKRVLTCELCHASMCKRCSKGPYCTSCYEKLGAITVESRRQAAKLKLQRRMLRNESIASSALDVLFPGAGMFYETRKHSVLLVPTVLFSALLYGLVAALLTQTYSYPLWVASDLYYPIYAATGIYVFAFLVRATLRTRRAFKGEQA